MPLVLLATIIAAIFLSPFIPLEAKQILYSLSIMIKSLIILLLPLIIFGLLFKAVVTLSTGATKIILTILAFVCCSNFLSTFLSHYVGAWVYNFDLTIIKPNETNTLNSLWNFHFPQIITNDKAMFAGIILGIIAFKLKPNFANHIADKIDILIANILKIFIYLIPLFVAGFVIKLKYDGTINMIIKDYTIIFVFIAIAQYGYIFLVYFLLNKGNAKNFIATIKNMIPAAISGFSTMSSAASMPLTIIAAQNNAKNKDLARSVIPATVNIHLVGDCFAIPIFAYAVLKSFSLAEPTLLEYLIFIFYFVLAKFSVAAVPGGGILVMLPILETHLGFNSDMLSLITALYVLFDPIITSANVLGNGAFAKMIDNWMLMRRKEA